MIILVPQGAEYQAVCRGLRSRSHPPTILPIPVGIQPVLRWLNTWQQDPTFPLAQSAQAQSADIIVMGLCGSLTPDLTIGDTVQYRDCLAATGPTWPCAPWPDPAIPLVTAFTSDRIIHTAADKQSLAHTYQADVVDMEGAAMLSVLGPLGIPVTMLRVVSDDAEHDLPDINAAIDATGNLQPWPLTVGMMRQPIAASRLIRGSMQGLSKLKQLAAAV
jgi:Phosphorylase superfamily